MEKLPGKIYESGLFTVLCNNSNCYYEKDIYKFCKKVGRKITVKITVYEYFDKKMKKLKNKFIGTGIATVGENSSIILDSQYNNAPIGVFLSQRGVGYFGRNYDSIHIDLTKTQINSNWKGSVCQGTPYFKIKN